MRSHQRLPVPDRELQQSVLRALQFFRVYHRYRVEGLERIPESGPVLVVASHSLATYDGFLLGAVIAEATGRYPRALGDNLMFKLPLIRDFAAGIGIVPASPANGEALLRQGEVLAVAPGGMREALRPSTEKYAVRWDDRRGFARLAVRTGTPVVLAACPAADDLYRVYPSRLTDLAYAVLKIPLPVARGVGPTAIPRPVALTHYLAGPYAPPAIRDDEDDDEVDDAVRVFHAFLVDEMAALLAHGATADRTLPAPTMNQS